jgi:GNAT superfamily N-acetyltransferase
MNYRLAIKEDFPQLAQMRWDFQVEDEAEKPVVEKTEFLEKCAGYLKKSAARGDWAFWIAEENGEIISQMFVHTIESVPRPARLENLWGYLTNVYTKPAFRGHGIGAQLLREVKSWAIEQDLELLIVSPSDDSIEFYKRAGFAEETDFYQLRLREF